MSNGVDPSLADVYPMFPQADGGGAVETPLLQEGQGQEVHPADVHSVGPQAHGALGQGKELSGDYTYSTFHPHRPARP